MEKTAEVYATERFVLQETFLKFKIRVLEMKAASNRALSSTSFLVITP